jgi:ADP-heptose:LPS heptosyltransferase
VIHAGSSTPARRWPASHFAAISDRLSGVGFAIVLTGTAAEREVTSAVAREMQVEATDLAGRTDLGSLAGVLAGAELLVTNDTGVSHLAAAVGVRSVVVFSGSDAERWAPLDADRHRTVLPNGDGDPAPVARAWEAVESLLAPAQMRVRQVAVS